MERRLGRPPARSVGHELVDVDPAFDCQGLQLLDVVGLDAHAGLQAVVALANNVIAGAVGELATFGAVEEPPHVDKADRLGRLAGNLKRGADELQDQGVGLLALCQGIDTTTAGSRSFFHMLVAIAEFERNLIVGPTRDGLAATRARAWKGDRRIDFLPP